MYKVTITDIIKPIAPEEAILRENGADLIYGDCKTEAELIELTQDTDAVINAYALLLCAARKIIPGREQVKSGQWNPRQAEALRCSMAASPKPC